MSATPVFFIVARGAALLAVTALPPAAPDGLARAAPVRAAADDPGTPAGSMAAMVRAIGEADAAGVRKYLDAASPAGEEFADATARYWAAAGAVWKALDARFGAGAGRLVSSFLPRPQDFDRLVAADWVVADGGGRATSGGPPASELRKVGGVWKLSPTTRKLSDRELRSLAARDGATAEFAERFAREIAEGKYATLADAQAVLDREQGRVGSGGGR